uniref:Gustatory receptor n=1 Tax=Tetranychus urticae TaxID=32264 RepID=T1KAN5_TETUR
MSLSSETELNFFAICKPTGIFAKALYSDNKLVFGSIAVLQLVNGLISVVQLWSLADTVAKVNFSICAATASNCGVCTIVIWLNRNKFVDIFNHFERNVNMNSLCSSVAPYLKKHRLLIKIHTLVCFALFFATTFYNPALKSNSKLILCKFIVISSIKTMGLYTYYTFLSFSIETFLYIQCCFLHVEHKIHELNWSNSEPNIVNIRRVRCAYCIAIENTRMLNSLLFFLFGAYFVLSFVSTHCALVALIADPAFLTAVITIGNTITFSLVIYHMIYINHLGTRIYEQVYTFSFKTYSLEVSKEIQLLLTRIARADVGLTFLDIFVITPTCVTSLATISLTIALATPAFTEFIILMF